MKTCLIKQLYEGFTLAHCRLFASSARVLICLQAAAHSTGCRQASCSLASSIAAQEVWQLIGRKACCAALQCQHMLLHPVPAGQVCINCSKQVSRTCVSTSLFFRSSAAGTDCREHDIAHLLQPFCLFLDDAASHGPTGRELHSSLRICPKSDLLF